MTDLDHEKFQSLVKSLYSIVDELQEMFPGRHFTPDGHMVGSLGECLVADAYGLELMNASNEGFDAVTVEGKKVEIKATQASAVAFRITPEHTIVIKIHKDGIFEEYLNGPGELVWSHFEGKKMPRNGQHIISLTRIAEIATKVSTSERIKRVNFPPQPDIETFLSHVSRQGLVHPGKNWDGLWKLLRRIGGPDGVDGLKKPLILAGAVASSEQKAARLRHHLEWAERHHCAAEAVRYLKSKGFADW